MFRQDQRGTQTLSLDVNGFYLVLSDCDRVYKFHWGLYLAKALQYGVVYHIISDSNGKLILETGPVENPFTFSHIILAIKLADMDPALHEALADRLAEVPVAYSTRFRENITCRVWVKEALFLLDDQGYIKLIREVIALEREAIGAAIVQKIGGTRLILKSAAVQV
ncbi:hypothetical protein LOZ53_001725 [Ophidiomyces ophidiicola]|nr:hypothetical protein LOZ55_003702 [Ophidiomyces ophidiicola]KAI1993990.1 hypothetical protein LOZ54_001176 [Ophidiomyces ophidiicola]KAI1994766.1 hypothetical protein LOZ53_001725 [Ophidiomyces ophidiicola]KAI1998159.1 hypothetical protein LOZ51_002837 [Ophidiomyces ophidiicola]